MKNVVKTIKFSKDLVAEFNQIAKDEGLLFTQAVRQAMKHYIKAKKNDR